MIGGAVNRAHGGGLLGIQTQAIAETEKLSASREGRALRLPARQPFLSQRLQRRFVEFKLVDLMTPDFP
jgi:hypothetical protein